MDRLPKVIEYIIQKCGDDKDKTGNPAYLHPLTVMNNIIFPKNTTDKGKEMIRIVALLHDVSEDYKISPAHIFAELRWLNYIDEEVKYMISALKLLTHEKSIPYEEYIDNIVGSNNLIAILVKYSDMEHNMYRALDLPQKDKERLLDKYSKHYPKLKDTVSKLIWDSIPEQRDENIPKLKGKMILLW